MNIVFSFFSVLRSVKLNFDLRVEKEEANSTFTKKQQQLQQQKPNFRQNSKHISPRTASARQITRVTPSSSNASTLSSTASSSSSSFSNKKSLIVNGDGTTTVTSVSKESDGFSPNGFQTQHYNKILRLSNLVKK